MSPALLRSLFRGGTRHGTADASPPDEAPAGLLPWRVVGGSALGTSHALVNKGCQDSHGWLVDAAKGSCFVVADGAGSRPCSADGSRTAIDAVLTAVAGLAADVPPDAATLTTLFEHARTALADLAAADGRPVEDYATTLAVVLIKGGRVGIGQVGDSIVVRRDPDGTLHTASPAPRFEYANETAFLTSTGPAAGVRIDELAEEDVDAVALSTDGLRFKILDNLTTAEPYSPFFEDVFAYVASGNATSSAVAGFIDGLEDQSGDDKTLVVAVKSSDPGTSDPQRVVNGFFAASPLPAPESETEPAGPAQEPAPATDGRDPS